MVQGAPTRVYGTPPWRAVFPTSSSPEGWGERLHATENPTLNTIVTTTVSAYEPDVTSCRAGTRLKTV